jgi:hypothetical protein
VAVGEATGAAVTSGADVATGADVAIGGKEGTAAGWQAARASARSIGTPICEIIFLIVAIIGWLIMLFLLII